MSATASRSYSSALRAEQAAETRRRVLAAAARLFTEQGYHATSLGAIAREAGVSIDTVQSTGAKRDLLLRAFEIALVGTETTDPIQDAPGPIAALLAEEDLDRFLAGAARELAAINRRSAALQRSVRTAALGDAAVASAYRGMVERRTRDYRALVGLLIARGAAVPPERRERLADELAHLVDPDGWTVLVQERGWSDAEYEAWLAERIGERIRAGAFRT
jgi:AcrR family transcriptional regulator